MRLAENVLHFARVLRVAGIPIGTDKVMDAVREALSRHMTANGVLMPAAVWIVHAA